MKTMVELIGGPFDGKKMQAKRKDDAIALPISDGYSMYVKTKRGKYEYQYTSKLKKVVEEEK